MPESKTVHIHGTPFTVTAPYAEGQTITALEAKVLNQTRAENIANNFRKAVRDSLDGVEGADPMDKLQADFANYDASYQFSQGGGGGGRSSMDPIERMARSIVKDAIRKQLSEKGEKLKDKDPEKIEAVIESNWQREDIIKLAKKKVAEAQKQLVSIDLGA